jgi:hypothetical protein
MYRYISSGCHGELLLSEIYEAATECKTTDYTRNMGRSTIASFESSANDDHLAIEFYSDTNCEDFYFSSDELVCVPNEDTQLKSYRVSTVAPRELPNVAPSKSIAKSGPCMTALSVTSRYKMTPWHHPRSTTFRGLIELHSPRAS